MSLFFWQMLAGAVGGCGLAVLIYRLASSASREVYFLRLYQSFVFKFAFLISAGYMLVQFPDLDVLNLVVLLLGGLGTTLALVLLLVRKERI